MIGAMFHPAISYARRNMRYAWPSNWRAGAKAAYRRLSKSGVLFSTDDLGMASLSPNQKIDRMCFEVAEHIHPDYVETFLDSLVRHSDTIAMSAAPPGQGGEGHFNEQPRSYWIAKLAVRGYRLHEEWTNELRAVNEFYSDNMMIFARSHVSEP
jgi:hypothetical protein